MTYKEREHETEFTYSSLLTRLIDMLHSPADVGAGDEGSDDRKDWGSLLQPRPGSIGSEVS